MQRMSVRIEHNPVRAENHRHGTRWITQNTALNTGQIGNDGSCCGAAFPCFFPSRGPSIQSTLEGTDSNLLSESYPQVEPKFRVDSNESINV